MRLASLALIISLLSTSCAAMFSGHKDTLHIISDESDTVFFVDSREIGRGKSTAVTLSKKGLGDKMLRAEKEGCGTITSKIDTKFDPTSLLGILIDFGIITVLVIDWAATGAIWEASQKNFVLTPKCPKTVRAN